MGDFFYIFSISFSIICIFRCFYDMILSRNKFNNCKVSIYVEYEAEIEAKEVEKLIEYIRQKYLIDANIYYIK